MQINVSGRHIDLTNAIEEYATRKAEKLTRYFNRVQQVDVLIDRTRSEFEVEIITDVEHHEPFVAKSHDTDLYACIDLGIDRAVRQLTDHKSRLRDNKHTHAIGSPLE